MSHRVNLYNVKSVSKAHNDDVMLVEWSYEFPLLFQPLFSSEAKFSANHYNNHFDDNTGLFYDAATGIKKLKIFYEFLEKHNEGLIEDIDGFQKAKEQLFLCLDALKQKWFHLDAWDVFNMSDAPHEAQAKQWAANFAQNNKVLEQAIAADQPSLLKKELFSGESLLGMNDFSMMLNTAIYNYGLEFIDENAYPKVEIFEENNLFGLKSETGKILLEPQFDLFYDFGESDMAVVVKHGKYGYVNKSGTIVIPLVYDDAYDEEGGFCIVAKDEKFGLIRPDGSPQILCIYQNLQSLQPSGKYWAAQLNDKWGVIEANNEIVLPIEHAQAPEEGPYNEFYFVPVKGKGTSIIYSHKFERIGEFDKSFVLPLSIGGDVCLYQVLQHKYSKENLLLSPTGKELLRGFEKPAENLSNVFKCRIRGKWGLINGKGELLLDFEYDDIAFISTQTDVPLNGLCSNVSESGYEWFSFIQAEKQGLKGIYFAGSHCSKWLFDVAFEDLRYIKRTHFAQKKNGYWSLQDVFGNVFSGLEYEEIIPVISYAGIAYGIHKNVVYTIGEYATEPANKIHLQDYLEANKEFDYYYFSRSIAGKIKAYVESV